jgi:hypothetical protein
VGAEYQNRTLRNFFDRFDENRAATPQLVNHVAIVHDLVMDIDRPAVCLKSQFDDVYGSHDTGTEASGTNPYQRFRPVGSLNVRKRQFALRSLLVYLKLVLLATPSEWFWC